MSKLSKRLLLRISAVGIILVISFWVMRMSNINISFGSNLKAINDFIIDCNVHISEHLLSDLDLFLSEVCIYTEEDTKIRPSVIIGNRILSDDFIKIMQLDYVLFSKDSIDKTNIRKRLKALLPFCLLGWRVFIDIDDKVICYGICRNYQGPTGLSVEELLSDLSDTDVDDVNFVLLDVEGNYAFTIKNYNSECHIDYRLIIPEKEEDRYDGNDARVAFLEDFTYEVPSDYKRAMAKIVDSFSTELHGSICLVVKSGCSPSSEIFGDGIILDKPISIWESLHELFSLGTVCDSKSLVPLYEKFRAYADGFLGMLNTDGITIVDTKGCIIGFNVFVKPKELLCEKKEFEGGARRRAVEYLWHLTGKEYVGAYFQSQDGMCYYRRMKNE